MTGPPLNAALEAGGLLVSELIVLEPDISANPPTPDIHGARRGTSRPTGPHPSPSRNEKP